MGFVVKVVCRPKGSVVPKLIFFARSESSTKGELKENWWNLSSDIDWSVNLSRHTWFDYLMATTKPWQSEWNMRRVFTQHHTWIHMNNEDDLNASRLTQKNVFCFFSVFPASTQKFRMQISFSLFILFLSFLSPSIDCSKWLFRLDVLWVLNSIGKLKKDKLSICMWKASFS